MLKKMVVLCFLVSIFTVVAYGENCSSAGEVGYKYTASGCSYTTQIRTCCTSKVWSDWGKSCPGCTMSGQSCDDWQIYADFDEVNCKCICPVGAIEVNGVCECDESKGYTLGSHECVKDNYKIVSYTTRNEREVCSNNGSVKSYNSANPCGYGLQACSSSYGYSGEEFYCDEDPRIRIPADDCVSKNYSAICASNGRGFSCKTATTGQMSYGLTTYRCKTYEFASSAPDAPGWDIRCDAESPSQSYTTKEVISVLECE